MRDALVIGARVLDREQAAANSEYVKTEFERTSSELERQFTDKARTVAEHFGTKVDEVFGPENGHLARDLEKLFGDGSAASVQNRVRELVAEALVRSREDLVRQFSAADGSNPLADFKAGALETITQAANRSHATERALLQQLGELRKELQGLRDEKDKLEEVARRAREGHRQGPHLRGGRGRLARRARRCARATWPRPWATSSGASGKTGDVVVDIGACDGPARGRVVFEAKDRRLSKPARARGARPGARRSRRRLRRARGAHRRGAAGQARAAARVQRRQARWSPSTPTIRTSLPLEVGYRLARARVLMARGGQEGVDGAAVHDVVERALHAMDDVRKVKSQLTGAKTGIDRAYEVVEEMAARVRAHLHEVDALVLAASPTDAGPPRRRTTTS